MPIICYSQLLDLWLHPPLSEDGDAEPDWVCEVRLLLVCKFNFHTAFCNLSFCSCTNTGNSYFKVIVAVHVLVFLFFQLKISGGLEWYLGHGQSIKGISILAAKIMHISAMASLLLLLWLYTHLLWAICFSKDAVCSMCLALNMWGLWLVGMSQICQRFVESSFLNDRVCCVHFRLRWIWWRWLRNTVLSGHCWMKSRTA